MSRVTRSWSILVFGVTFAIVLLARTTAPVQALRQGSGQAPRQGSGQPTTATAAQIAPFVGDWLVTVAGDGKRRHLRGVGEERRRNSLRDDPIGRPAHRERDGHHGGGKQPGPEVHVAADGHADLDGADPDAGRCERSSQHGDHGRPVRDVRHRGEAGRRARPVRATGFGGGRGAADERRHRLHAEAALSAAHAGRGSRRLHAARRLSHGARRRRPRRHQPDAHRVRRQRPHVRRRDDQLHDGRRAPAASTIRSAASAAGRAPRATAATTSAPSSSTTSSRRA